MDMDAYTAATKIRHDIGSRYAELAILADIQDVTEDQAFFNESMRIIIRDEIIDLETKLKIIGELFS
jgi:hypothetical protein